MPDRPTRYFRIVETNPPTLWDFMSMEERGKELQFQTPLALRLWTGLSVFEEIAQAHAQRERYPYLGDYIAELEIPTDRYPEIRCERTTRTPGHWTLWGDANELLACVTMVTSP
jgi:hypothetical protein